MIFTCADWILSFVQEMGVSPDPERGWSTQQNLFLSFLICEAKTGPTCQFLFFQTIFNSKSQYIKRFLELGLSACTECILSLKQEMGVSTDLEGGWFTQQNFFLRFCNCEG